MGRFRTWVMGASMAIVALGLPMVVAPSAGAVVGGACNEYAPTTVAVSVPHATAGTVVSVSGLAVPGSTVDVEIGQVTFQQIGTTTAGPFGTYSTSVTIPLTLTPGTYTIRITSPGCPVQASVSFVVDAGPPATTTTSAGPTTTTTTSTTTSTTTTTIAPTTTTTAPATTTTVPGGGTCASNPTLIKRKQVVTFTLLAGFKTNQTVTLSLAAQFLFGPILTLYSGSYPPSGQVTVTIPGSAVDGWYHWTQTGTGLNGLPKASSCSVKVQGTMPAAQSPSVLGETITSPVVKLASASLAAGSGSDSTPMQRPLVALMLMVVAGASLVLLRVRRRT